MNNITCMLKVQLPVRIIQPRFYAIFRKCKQSNKVDSRIRKKSLLLNEIPALKPVNYFSNYNSVQTKNTDTLITERSNGKFQKILEDEEFQNILKDFVNDFGVNSDEDNILNDIRKNIDGKEDVNGEKDCTADNNAAPVVEKYKNFIEFSDNHSTVILSYEEQDNLLSDDELIYHIGDELKPKSRYGDLKRGITGVFDLHELIEVLKNESLMDITAISIPEELHYADTLVIATAKSARHSDAIAELIKKLYKQKRNKFDPFVKVEGKDVTNWKAMDMGNIVLHIFLEDARDVYDLESLWLFDSDYDSGGRVASDPMLDILEEQMEFFNSLQQSESSGVSKETS